MQLNFIKNSQIGKKITRKSHHLNPMVENSILAEGIRFKVRQIIMKPSSQLSLHLHYHRAKHWIIVNGTALIINNDSSTLLTENESCYIPIGIKHQIKNNGIKDLILIEIETGIYLEDDDVVVIRGIQ